MNPFTRFLSQWGREDDPVQLFIPHWDVVEALAIRVYKGKGATAEDEEQYQAARVALLKLYPQLEEALRPYWEASLVGGRTDHEDPFRYVLTPEAAAGFVDNWAALQHLPAAREALNQLLVASSDDDG